MKKIFGRLLTFVLAASAVTLVGCGGGGEASTGGNNTSEGSTMTTYKLEAELANLTNPLVQGAGISSDQKGLQMIYPSDYSPKDIWSGGFFLGYTYTTKFALDFKFTADEEGSAVIKIALGSEMPEDIMSLKDSEFEISINGEVVHYGSFSIRKSELSEMKFKEYVVSGNAKIKKGENVVNLKVKDNKHKNGEVGAPTIDYLLVKTSTKITPEQFPDNLKRDEF